ncbi:MAG: hypothetical protein EZS28_031951, partial [Streblomastix strix]
TIEGGKGGRLESYYNQYYV